MTMLYLSLRDRPLEMLWGGGVGQSKRKTFMQGKIERKKELLHKV